MTALTPEARQRLRETAENMPEGEYLIRRDRLLDLLAEIDRLEQALQAPVRLYRESQPLAALDRRAEGETCGTCRFWDADSLAMGYCGKGVITPRMLSADERTRFGCTLHEPAPPSGGQT